MLTKDKFIKDVKAIYPEGNLDHAYNNIQAILRDKEKDSEGNPVTYEYIIKKFSDYHKAWNMKYARHLSNGYLSKEAESQRKTINQFITEGLYLRDYSTTPVFNERDEYLFGKNFNELYEKIIKIEKQYFNEGQTNTESLIPPF